MERSSRVEPSPAALHWPETNHPDVDREAVRGKLADLCSEDRRYPRINRRTVQISHPNRPSIDGSVLTAPVPARVWRKTETKDPSGGPVEESEGMIRPSHPLLGRLPKHFRPRETRTDYRFNDREDLAGVVGFEPTVHGTKNRCLTTWLHPNSAALITLDLGAVQGRK